MSALAIRPVTDIALDLNTALLGTLATQIEAAHQAVVGAGADLIDHAIRAGELLIEAKALAGHGCWETWLAEHCPQSARRAQRYMRFARHKSKIDQIRHGAAGLALDVVERALSLRELDHALAGPSRGTKGDDRIRHEEQPPLIEPFTFSVITTWAGILSEMTPAQKVSCWADLLAFQQAVNAVVRAGCPILDRP